MQMFAGTMGGAVRMELVARAGNDTTIELLAKYLSLTRNTS